MAIVDEKGHPPPPPMQSNYGNMPLDVASSSQPPGKNSKFNENGKKFGKKMGNAGMWEFMLLSKSDSSR